MGLKNFHFPNALILEQYQALKPLEWTVNFSNGTSGNRKKYKEFHLIPMEKRKEIRAMRFISGDKNITVSRKTGDIISEGFFYHIKAARKTMMGVQQGLDIPYFEERIGFCYNSNGDARCVMIDHSGYVAAVGKKFEKIRDILAGLPNNHPELQKEHINLDAIPEIKKILDKDIVYGINIRDYDENIACKEQFANGIATIRDPKPLRNTVAINIPRFGGLEELPELGTPPRITTNIEETISASNI